MNLEVPTRTTTSCRSGEGPPPSKFHESRDTLSITVDGFSQKPYTFGERGAVEAFSFTVRCPNAILPEDVGLDSKLDVACIDLSTADIEGDAPTPDLWGSMLGTELDYHKLTAGSDVVISGYPSVLTNDGGLEAGERPILVSGIIASDPRYPATFGDRKLEEAVLTHSLSWGGMSGSPVFALVRNPHGGRLMNPRPGARPSPEHHIILAGVNAGHFQLQQESSAAGAITHFMKASIIAQMIGYTTGHAMVGPVAMPEPE